MRRLLSRCEKKQKKKKKKQKKKQQVEKKQQKTKKKQKKLWMVCDGMQVGNQKKQGLFGKTVGNGKTKSKLQKNELCLRVRTQAVHGQLGLPFQKHRQRVQAVSHTQTDTSRLGNCSLRNGQ